VHVVLDRRDLDRQPLRDLLVREPFVEQGRDLVLARRQACVEAARVVACRRRDPLQQEGGDPRRADHLAARHALDHVDQLVQSRVAGDVSGDAGLGKRDHLRRDLPHAERDDLRGRLQRGEVGDGVARVDERQVEQDDVRTLRHRRVECREDVGGGGDDVAAAAPGEGVREPLPVEADVAHDERSDHAEALGRSTRRSDDGGEARNGKSLPGSRSREDYTAGAAGQIASVFAL
jgi:hypothetical protein